jgi:lipoyl(octanoyl) transferase
VNKLPTGFNKYIFEIYKGLMPYEKGIELMNEKLTSIIEIRKEETILLLEHEDIYTAGRMVQDKADIIDKNIQIINTDRGGKITYHGPGQRVVYPIMDLNHFQKDIKKYISFLQNLIINTLYKIGIEAHTDRTGIGVWTIKENDLYKIASIGIRVKKWVAHHGLAINISNDLKKFDAIIPCGIKDYKHTSIKKLGINIELEEFDKIFIKEFNKLIDENNIIMIRNY